MVPLALGVETMGTRIALALSSLMFTMSCDRVSNTFVIYDPDNVVVTAQVRLCGSTIKLNQDEGVYLGRMVISCEGEGNILLDLSGNRKASCHIGYVTPGIEQNFTFVIEHSRCVPKRLADA